MHVEVQEKEATAQMLLSKQQSEWRRAIEGMRRRGVARAYSSWVRLTRDTVRLVAIGTRVVHQLQHRAAGQCLAQWQGYCSRCRLLERVGRRVLHRQTGRAMSCWVNTVDQWRSERQGAEHAAALETLRQQMHDEAQEKHMALSESMQMLHLSLIHI